MSAAIRAATIANGFVVNVEMISPGFERAGVTFVPSGTAEIGDRYEGGEFIPRPLDIPPPPPIEIAADVLFFDRMTDDEYGALDASVKAGETARVYRGWTAATVFNEGSAMWTLLDKHLSLVVRAERKAELLARPIQSAALAGDEALPA